MTVGDLLSDLYRDFNFGASPDAIITTRLKGYINKAYNALLREPSLARLRDTTAPLTFASVANQAIYGLPSQLSRISAITERDNDRDLESMTLDTLRRSDPGLTSTGTPWAFVPLGYGPTKYTPASTGIWAASSASGDTTQVVQINGVRSNGLPTGDITATLTGTSRVQLGTLTDYVELQTVTISAVGTGLITLYDASSSGNTLAEIPIGQLYPRYWRVQLYPMPESAITYYVDGTYNIPILDDTVDVPMLPEEFHDLLAAYARMREYEKQGDLERNQLAEQEWTTGVNRLKHKVATSGAETHVLGRPMRRRFSRLGPWAPEWTEG